MKVKTIYAEILNQCNLNCRTCYNRSGLNRERRELSKARLEEILRTFLPYGLERFLLSGGEPTLHTEFDGILDLADAYPQVSFGIVTNGTNPSEKLAGYVNQGKISLQISLDGSCEEENAKTRGAGNFAKTMAFARRLRRAKDPIRLKMVLSQQNREDLEGFYRLARSIGFSPEFAFIYRSGNGAENWEGKALSARQKLEALRQIRRLNRECGEEAFLPLCTMGCPFILEDSELSLCVKVDGSIQPCQALYDERFTLGNALSFDPEAFAANVENLRVLARRRLETDYGCGTCLLREGCRRGCMAAAVCLCGDPLGNDGDCGYRKLQFLGFDLQEMLKERSTGGTGGASSTSEPGEG